MRILFYYPSNKRTISIESIIIRFRNEGHSVVFLTQSSRAELHEELQSNGIVSHAYVITKTSSIVYYIKHIVFLVKFCKAHKVDFVYSHLQQANIVSVIAQYFCKSRFYICRHHSSVSGADRNFNQSLFDIIINRLAKLIIVPSKAVYNQVNKTEHVSSNRIKLIPYGYDFSKYPQADPTEVENIKLAYPCKLRLVKIARLVPGKRYMKLFLLMKELIEGMNLDIKLLVISEGPLYKEFQGYINTNRLNNHVFLLGNKSNVIDYISAADVVPLLSEAEASNSVIKEAGLMKKCVLVCRDVGDFEDYITDGLSGYFMDKEDPVPQLKDVLLRIYNKEIDVQKVGDNLYENVINTFSIDKVVKHYEFLNATQ